MKIQPIKTKIFSEGENLFRFITSCVRRLPERSVLVVTSKIVALAERRTAPMGDAKAKELLIRKESDFAIPAKYAWLTVKNGIVMPSAGIDESNANGKFVLLPNNSFKTARLLRNALQKRYRVKHLGILITDSRTMPFRAGVAGVALGYAGFYGIKDYRGKPDVFGRKFKFSKTNVADCLASAAVLVMGEGNERQPLAIIEDAPIEFLDIRNHEKVHIGVEDDMYREFFLNLPKRKISPRNLPKKVSRAVKKGKKN